MAKQIKFHLKINGYSVRNIDDLKDNFVLQDVYDLYTSGVLGRWLSAWGEESYLNKMSEIEGEDQKETLEKLVNIFNVTTSNGELESALLALSHFEDRKKMIHIYRNSNHKLNSDLVDKYHNQYDELKKGCFEHYQDVKALQTIAREIESNYFELFKLDQIHFIRSLLENAPSAVIAMLSSQDEEASLRACCLKNREVINFYEKIKASASSYSLPIEKVSSLLLLGEESYVDDLSSIDTLFKLGEKADDQKSGSWGLRGLVYSSLSKSFYSDYNSKIQSNCDESTIRQEGQNYLQNQLPMMAKTQYSFFSGETDDYWKDLEVGKRVMILHIPQGSMVRSSGKREEEITQETLDGTPFLILEGLDYKSRTEGEPLIYLEVE